LLRLQPEETSQLQVLVVNTGGTPIDWNVTEQPCGACPDWVKVDPPSGALNSFEHALIKLTASYPKELATGLSVVLLILLVRASLPSEESH
jgi:hypothetical protein